MATRMICTEKKKSQKENRVCNVKAFKSQEMQEIMSVNNEQRKEK